MYSKTRCLSFGSYSYANEVPDWQKEAIRPDSAAAKQSQKASVRGKKAMKV